MTRAPSRRRRARAFPAVPPRAAPLPHPSWLRADPDAPAPARAIKADEFWARLGI